MPPGLFWLFQVIRLKFESIWERSKISARLQIYAFHQALYPPGGLRSNQVIGSHVFYESRLVLSGSCYNLDNYIFCFFNFIFKERNGDEFKQW